MPNKITDYRTKRLLISNILFRSGTLVSQIFLNIFLFKNTNDIQLIALFNIILLVVNLGSMNLFAGIVKSGYRNLIHVTGLLGLSGVYLLLILFGELIIPYYIFLSIGIGFFGGMYWIVYNSNEFDLTTVSNRGNYQGLKKSFKTLAAIIIPSLIGSIIGLNYFGYGYELSFGIGIILFLMSAFLGILKIEYGNKTKYCINGAIKRIVKNKNLVKVLGNYSLLGFFLSNPLIETILPLLLFSYGISEIKLGFFLSFFALLTVIISYLFGKYVHYKNYKCTYIFSGLLYILSVLFLLIFPSYWYIILFSSILNLLFTFMDIPQSVLGSNILHEVQGYEDMKLEYMAIREWPLLGGRILAFVCIYFIGSFSELGIQTLFGIMALVLLVSMYLFYSIRIKH